MMKSLPGKEIRTFLFLISMVVSIVTEKWTIYPLVSTHSGLGFFSNCVNLAGAHLPFDKKIEY
jgi:hypothetical protein